MNINRLKQLSLINDKFTLEILKSKIFLNFQQSFHFSTNISIIEQRISNKNFLKYFQTFPSTFNFEIRKKESKSIRTILKPSKFTYSELLKKKNRNTRKQLNQNVNEKEKNHSMEENNLIEE